MTEPRFILFFLNGKEILRYTIRGTFPGELENTKEILANQYGVEPNDIKSVVMED